MSGLMRSVAVAESVLGCFDISAVTGINGAILMLGQVFLKLCEDD